MNRRAGRGRFLQAQVRFNAQGGEYGVEVAAAVAVLTMAVGVAPVRGAVVSDNPGVMVMMATHAMVIVAMGCSHPCFAVRMP
ncbi:MAG TPA: hypothetical protein VFP70_08600 [Burkholderiales bacterium]|nr:hypothetical protein [Burkholderiales bacterium]